MNAIDRDYVQSKMNKLKPNIEVELEKLKGYGMKWQIYNEYSDSWETFDIDKQNVDEFCPFLRQHDLDGCESYLEVFYPANDERIKTKEKICREVLEYIRLLIPLYNAMVWRMKV